MTEQNIKKAQVFESNQSSADDNSSAELVSIKPVKHFNSGEFIDEQTLQAKVNGAVDSDDVTNLLADSLQDDVIKEPRKPKRWSLLAKLSLLAIGLLVIVQTVLGLVEAFTQSPILFGFYSVVLTILISWLTVMCGKEWRKLADLKKVTAEQDTAARLTDSMQMGEAEPFIASLLAKYPNNQAKKAYLAQANVEHNDAEKVMLFDDIVLSERDILAKKYVTRYAAESALLLAASPLAALDMALILWRNQAMISKIASVYGIELGYWSRIKLIRAIIVNIIYAGATEVATDLGTQLLSVEMTGKLSARIAQGLGGGLLTARLGYQAMSLCRPVRFTADNRPKLSQIHQHLLSELKGLTSAVMSKPKVADKDKIKHKEQ